MADSATDVDYPVYLGVWTNWSQGNRISGSTLTLTHRNGALLTAFLALFVTFTGSRLWRIACFALHQLLLSGPVPQDGLYHQRQAILRNSVDEKSAFLSFVRVLLAWKAKARRPFIRILPLVAFSAFITAGFALSSIFSAKISSSMGSEVLLASSECGTLSQNSSFSAQTADELLANVYNPWVAKRISLYANYAQRCYTNDSSAGDCRGPYVKQTLPSFVDRNASCPFASKICRDAFGNIRIDTGYLNSDTHLGFNTPVDSQFNLRIITSCAPLESEGYKKTVTYSFDKPYSQYFYGSRRSHIFQNASLFTYEMPQQSANETEWEYIFPLGPQYRIDAYPYYVFNRTQSDDYSLFDPIEDLRQNDGDVTLFSLSANGIQYSKPVDDPWYSAHQAGPLHGYDGGSGLFHTYLADEAAPALACKVQYQTCDPASPSNQTCSPWGGADDVNYAMTPPETKKERILNWVLSPSVAIADVVIGLSQSALTSRYKLINGVQAELPANQWQLEVENWNSISLAAIQGGAVDWSTGPGDPEMQEYFWRGPMDSEEKYFCKSQKIISTSYTNFSMMWLTIILVLGTLVVLLEITMEPIFVWLEERGLIKTSSAEWFNNDTLQLQRMAHEEIGLGNWKDSKSPLRIPVTEKGQLLGILDCSDRKHPRLINPTTVSDSFKTEKVSSSGSSDVQPKEIKVETDLEQGLSPLSPNSTLCDALSPFGDTKDTAKTEITRVNTVESTSASSDQTAEQKAVPSHR